MSGNGDQLMTDMTSETVESPLWEPLPATMPEVVAFIAARIRTWSEGSAAPWGQPTDMAGLLQGYVNNPDPALLPSPEYLAQREAIRELGLDPDILAPIKPVDLTVGFYLARFTFPIESTQAWILGNGWSQADCDTICSQLVFIDPAAVAYVATLTPGVQTINGNLVNIIL